MSLLRRAALAVSLAVVLGVTLRPIGGSHHLALAPWAGRQLNAVNVIGNVALFALPAAVLWSLGWALRRTVLAGFGLSLGIELVQLAIPGRTTSSADVLCNTLGAAVGWLVAARLAASAAADGAPGEAPAVSRPTSRDDRRHRHGDRRRDSARR